MKNKTVIIGATPNPARYAFTAANMLSEQSYEIVPMGIRDGEVAGNPILDIRKRPLIEDVHTITLYVAPHHQPALYDYIFSLKPKRIIFNPGTENEQFKQMAAEKGIETMEACTMVLLRSNQF